MYIKHFRKCQEKYRGHALGVHNDSCGPAEADCVLPNTFCWLSEHFEPAGACFSLFHLASRLSLHSEAALTSWWSWVAAGYFGP